MLNFYIFRHFKFIKIPFNNDKENRNNYHYLKKSRYEKDKTKINHILIEKTKNKQFIRQYI